MTDKATIQKSPVQVELTMELRWAVQPGDQPELQQAGYLIGESSKKKVWFPVRFEVLTHD